MNEEFKRIEEALKAPFPPEDIEWRISRAGQKNGGKIWATVLAYITSRAVMDRLDEVVGCANWKVDYQKVDGGFLCYLSIKFNGEWITKVDGADASDVEPFKGGISGALKRAAVPWGIGRYLYNLTSGFAQVLDTGTRDSYKGEFKGDSGKVYFHWLPPELPEWALPSKAASTKVIVAATTETLEKTKVKLEQSRKAEQDKAIQSQAKAEPSEAGSVPGKAKAKRSKEEIEAALKECENIRDLQDFWKLIKNDLADLDDADVASIVFEKDKLKESFTAKA